MDTPLFTQVELTALGNAINLAQTDAAFRELVVTDLAAALAQVGLALPDRATVRASLIASGMSTDDLDKFDNASLEQCAEAMGSRPLAVGEPGLGMLSGNFYRGVPRFHPAAHWWGFHVPFAFADADDIFKVGQAINSLVGTLGGFLAKAAPPIAPFVTAIVLYVVVQVAVIKGVSVGCQRSGAKGVWVSMVWLAPGVFVPTCVC